MHTLQAWPRSTAVRRCWEPNAIVHSPADGKRVDTQNHITCIGGLAGDVRVMSTSPLERRRCKRCGEGA
jgi:hypothetical protein